MTERLLTNGRCPAAYIILTGLFVLAHWAIYALLPMMSDDYWYASAMMPWIDGTCSGIPWREMGATISTHFLHDNGRLGNILLVPLLMLPRWAGAIVPAVAVGWIVTGCCRFAHIGPRQLIWLTLTLCGISVMLPWFENLFVLCYGLNYIVPSAMSAWFVCHLVSEDRLRGPAVANALLLGAWNEAFSLPLLAGGLMMAIMSQRPRRRQILRRCMLLVPGLLYLLMVIAHVLATDTITPANGSPLTMTIRFGKLQVPLLCLIILLAIEAIRTRDMRVLVRPWVILTLTAAMVALTLSVLVPRGERASTIIHLLSLMGIMRIGLRLAGPRWRVDNPRTLTAAALLAALLAWHYTAVVAMTARIHDAWRTIDLKARTTPGGPIFADIRLPEYSGLILWRKPTGVMLDRWNMTTLNRAYPPGGPDAQPRSIIPDALRHIRPGDGTPVPGTSDVRTLEGWHFRPDDGRDTDYYSGKVGPFAKRVYFYAYPFRADDGGRYLFLYPQMSYFPTFFFSIDRLDEENDLL